MTGNVQWTENADGWLGQDEGEVVVRIKKFTSGWFRATRTPGQLWSGWIGPFKTDALAKDGENRP